MLGRGIEMLIFVYGLATMYFAINMIVVIALPVEEKDLWSRKDVKTTRIIK